MDNEQQILDIDIRSLATVKAELVEDIRKGARTIVGQTTVTVTNDLYRGCGEES